MDMPDQITPFWRHLDESLLFTGGVVYLYEMEKEIRALPESDITKSHFKFKDRINSKYETPKKYFFAQMFPTMISNFEIFMKDTVIMVVREHPKKIGDYSFKLTEIIEADNINILIEKAADEYLNKLMYKKPKEYMSAICDLLSIDEKEISREWMLFIEAKARRDVGVHNAWKCNSTYHRKLAEAGIEPSHEIGDSLLPTDTEYAISIHDNIMALAEKITSMVLKKYWPEIYDEWRRAISD